MKKLLIFILAIFLSLTGFGQISTDERPVSFDTQIIANVLQEQRTDMRVMPSLDMERIQEEDERDEQQGIPPRFGFPHDVSLDLDNSGTWGTLPNGDRIWRLSLHCPEALSINLLYDKFHLPQGAKLFLYTEDKKHYIGAFTHVNNKDTEREPEGFATGLLYGETITLEYYLPKEVEEKGVISIARIVHGYRYINISDDFAQSLASSGNCQVNVNCPEGTNWQQEKNAVALILVNGNRYCTGSLINTTCNDDRPLLLTADHCLGGWANDYVKHDAITNPHLPHWSFYWQYESPTCSGSSSQILSTVGATVIANNGNTDFALLRLTEDPKNRNGVTPYYLGWDRSGNSGTGGVGIHHPSGDIKKISTYSITPDNSDCMNFAYNGVYLPNNNFWKINWIATPNGHSVTEGGSSGSPLINGNKRVIGQLFGFGLCPDPNCSNPSQDIGNYGKFSVSWTGDGATDNRRKLSDWLDPLGISGNTLDGKAATLITGPSSVCTSETYTLTNLPTGATVVWTATGSISISGANNVNPINAIKNSDGIGSLTATITTVCGDLEMVKNGIQVGLPVNPSFSFHPSSNCANEYVDITLNIPGGTSITSMTGKVGSTHVPLSQAGSSTYILPPNVFQISYTLLNSCGSKSFTKLIPRANCL